MLPYDEAMSSHIREQLEAVAQIIQIFIFGEKLEMPQSPFGRIV
jgi:hypothetical protein